MAPVVIPYVPEFITVHLGPASQSAENVTVSFPDYIKNVASSEIYPTWELSALRANILAQISFALNRVYTEYYVSRGYPFQITSTTATDQKFIKGRNIFDNIDRLVDDIFNDYIRRQGFVEPLAAKFCNGTTVTCDGLSQWGSQELAQQGLDSMAILRRYYGNDIELVVEAPVQGLQNSYPGSPLRRDTAGPDVVVVQTELNRIGQNYPAIPKIQPVDGVFGQQTEEAVRRFQEIFGLTADGVVGKATWYRLVSLYVGVNRLSELVSEGQRMFGIPFQAPQAVSEGSPRNQVLMVQYFLSILAQFDPLIPFVTLDGIYGPATRQAVRSFQTAQGIPVTGTVDTATWNALYSAFEGIDVTVLSDDILFPAELQGLGNDPDFYSQITRMTQFPGRELRLGDRDVERSGS
ncbi:peptidoglycan-binding protein [Intestinimonas massiliensis]|uniref:Peptidoglycan-binding protein n=1 Tax=Intestinimonas massiliensis (ex Afouda et al. 2020) TaxID=1673721 RepID=A0ABS9MCF3_9FIRM|nr:peptidoglycan-binding protein [Intestinimonas massiliensis (ex Afouda et al. 2020)]MCG4528492.1 peptidoglycan-binding protein [Intestinimonas massiliensis (ex Afouda et al. 2020)]MCQ4807432.1 peptidoglycan-binding protein [Intestinimonas massiliensis (ex Afouda et al. 2020)]